MLPHMTVSLAWNSWRSPKLSADELQDLRDRKLRQLICHAFEQVPYYRTLLTSVGLSPEDVQATDDLNKIPVSTKEDLVTAGLGSRLAQSTSRATCCLSHTSGSSGEPLSTYLNEREQTIRRLLGLRRLVEARFRPWDRLCFLCDPTQLSSRRFRTRVVPVGSPPEEQIGQLQRIKPTVLKAWPSSLSVLMHHTRHQLGRFIQPRIVALSGEECSDELRGEIESDLKAEVFVFYGAGEFGPIASECRNHDGLHINADQLIVECGIESRPNEPGDLVITSLFGLSMPFIRYRIGDTGILQEKACPCGSRFPILTSLQGRSSQVIRLPEGRMASVAAVVNTALRPFPTLQKFRLIQESVGEFVLQTVFLEPPVEETLSHMKRRMSECLGSGVDLAVTVVDTIDEGGVRKFGNFTSKLTTGPTLGPLNRN